MSSDKAVSPSKKILQSLKLNNYPDKVLINWSFKVAEHSSPETE